MPPMRPESQVTVPSPRVVPTIFSRPPSSRTPQGVLLRHAEHVDALALVVGGQRRAVRPSCCPQPAPRSRAPPAAGVPTWPLPNHRSLHLGLRSPPRSAPSGSRRRPPPSACALEHVHESGLGQQLQRAAEAGDDVEHLLHVVLHVEAHERAQRVALAEQVLDHRVRALVRRAQHDQPRAVARHQRIHHRASLVDARAHHQPAHAVREQADRLPGLLEQPVEELAEPLAQHVQRLPPVVGEALDAVAVGQTPCTARRRTCRTALRPRCRGCPQAIFARPPRGDVQRVEPDAVPAVRPAGASPSRPAAPRPPDDRPRRTSRLCAA